MQKPATKSQSRKAKALAWTAYHEAGHAVAARFFRLPVKLVSIIPGEGFAGFVQFGDTCGRNAAAGLLNGASFDGLTRILKELIVLLAGMEAQRHYSPQSCRKSHPSSDYAQAVDFSLSFCAGDVQEAEFFLRWVCKRAENLVTGILWADIHSLADELVVRREMTGREVSAFLKARTNFRADAADW